MARMLWIGTLLILATTLDVSAQYRIDKNLIHSHPFNHQSVLNSDSENLDTLILGSIKTTDWDKYTSKFGKSFEFGVFLTLPDPGYPFRIISWNLPFYGGGYQSGGLREAGLIARFWSGINSNSSISEDSIRVNTSSKSFKIGSFEYLMADFSFSNAPFFNGTHSVGLSILYDSGPDSLAISPIWTSEKMIQEMFYSRLVPLTDSTTQRKYFNHSDFWSSMKVNGNKFGQLSGFVVVEIDTSRIRNNGDVGGPLGTGLNEKWYLPGSHRVIDNYPNPFNPATKLRIMPQLTGNHEVKVYDVSGRIIFFKSLSMRAGHEYVLDLFATNWSSGVYIVSVHTSNYRWIHPITFVK